jgi:glycosyltransferase involved in cell wall biosynthesis
MKNPSLSVLMPVYNAERFLAQAVDSILNQTFTDFEFLIINDGSTDSTSKILETYSDPRMKIYHREHLGYVPQLNYGLTIAESEIIARMDADDVSLPARFEMQYKILQEDPSIGVVSSSVRLIDSGDVKGAIKWFPKNNDEIKKLFPVFCPICHPASMFRKELILSQGGYDEKLVPAEDFDLWLRLSNVTQFANVESPQLLLRKHDNEITRTMAAIGRQQRLNLSLQYIEKQLSTVSDVNKRLNLNYQYALCHYYHGRIREARKTLFPLFLRKPWKIKFLRYLLPTFLGEWLFQGLRKAGISEFITNYFRSRKHLEKYISP